MNKVSICICTRRRPEGLLELLNSINKIQIPDETEVSIIIVENDQSSQIKETLEGFIPKSIFEIKCFLETNQGISYARNRSVKEAGDCDFCCFVDDDQTVKPDWLVELFKCQREFDADGVSGSTPALFKFDVPKYIVEHHKDDEIPYGTIVKKAATGCLLMRKKILDKIEGPFNIQLNFTGGEDFYMTHQASTIGAVIRTNQKAISHEIIPKDRTTIRYVVYRSYRTANTKLLVQSLIGENYSGIKLLPRILMRLGLGILIVIPCFIFLKKNKLLGLFKISYALGGLTYIFFARKNRFYK